VSCCVYDELQRFSTSSFVDIKKHRQLFGYTGAIHDFTLKNFSKSNVIHHYRQLHMK
jgi:hypothetical protein